jgi:hypothetical protein
LQPLEHRSYVAFHALAVRDQHHSLKATLSLVLEGGNRRGERAREVGGGIGEVVSGTGFEEPSKRAMVGGER